MPDSRHLVVSGAGRGDEGERLFLLDTAGGEISWLTGSRALALGGDLEPAVSPDGQVESRSPGGIFFDTGQQLFLLSLSPDNAAGGRTPQAGV